MRISATDMLVQCATIKVKAASIIKSDSIERVIRSAFSLSRAVDMLDPMQRHARLRLLEPVELKHGEHRLPDNKALNRSVLKRQGMACRRMVVTSHCIRLHFR